MNEGISTKYVAVTVDLIFVGKYYDAEECMSAAEEWISSTLGDRDDLNAWTIRSTVRKEAPGDPEGLLK